jgi:hypothetical protein
MMRRPCSGTHAGAFLLPIPFTAGAAAALAVVAAAAASDGEEGAGEGGEGEGASARMDWAPGGGDQARKAAELRGPPPPVSADFHGLDEAVLGDVLMLWDFCNIYR